MKNRVILLAALAGIITGCSPQYKEQVFEVLPEGLKDCKVYSIRNGDGLSLTVVRCPNSSTSVKYREGKSDVTVSTVEESEAMTRFNEQISKLERETAEAKLQYKQLYNKP